MASDKETAIESLESTNWSNECASVKSLDRTGEPAVTSFDSDALYVQPVTTGLRRGVAGWTE